MKQNSLQNTMSTSSETFKEMKINIYNLLRNKKTKNKIKALKLLIDKSQFENMSEFYLKVVQISDTRNTKLKWLINYYLLLYGDNLGLLMLTTNTLLKDLNDTNEELQLLAIEFIGKTKYLDEYFLREFIKIYRNGTLKIKNAMIRSLGRFFNKKEWVIKYELIDLIKEAFRNPDNITALETIFEVFDLYDIIEDNEIIELCKTKTHSIEKRILILMIIQKKINNIENIHDYISKPYSDQNKIFFIESIKELCIQNLYSMNLEIIYLSSQILLKISNENSTIIYNSLLKYSKYGTYRSYFVLESIRDMIIHQKEYDFFYNNEDFLIYTNDPIYIKRTKLDILCFNIDSITKNEIDNLTKDDDLIFDLLFLGLKHKIFIRGILEKCFKENHQLVIQMIYFSDFFTDILSTNNNLHHDSIFYKLLSEDIKNIFKNIQFEDEFQDKVIFILSKICMDYDEISNYQLYFNEINQLQFYLNLYFRRIINKTILLNKTNIIESLELEIKKYEETQVINDYLLRFINFRTECKFEFKPNDDLFDTYKHLNYVGSDIKFERYFQKLSIKASRQRTQHDKIILSVIEEPEISLQVVSEERILKIDIIKLDKPIKLNISPYINQKIRSKDNIYITTLDDKFSLQEFIVKLDKKRFVITLRLIDFVAPYEITLKEFNAEFGLLKNYEIFDEKYLTTNKYNVEHNIFTFKIFEVIFYGMIMSGQVVLKCVNKTLLNTFVKAITNI